MPPTYNERRQDEYDPRYRVPDGPRVGLLRSLRRKLAALLSEKSNTPGPREVEPTSQTGATDATYGSFSDRLWQVYYDRRSTYKDLQEMDQNDPVVTTSLSIHADCTVCYEDISIDGFEWTMKTKDEQAQQILDDLKERLQLGQEVWQIVRGFVCFGEEYREIVVDDDNNVVSFPRLPAYQIMPNFGPHGNRIPGWVQKCEGAAPKKIPFDEWQIVSFQWGPRRGYFGTGLMTSSRRPWRRLQKLADGMAIARMTRAYDKLVHRVPVKPEWNLSKQFEAIKNYRFSLTKRRGLDQDGNVSLRDDPLAVTTEIFIPDDGTKRGGVEVLALQNMQLMNVEDLRYHQDEILAALRVPRKYLNMVVKGQSLSDASIAAEDVQFARILRQNQATLRTGLLQLARIALLLKGFDSRKLGVGVKLAAISAQDQLTQAKVEMNLAQAAQVFAQTLLTGAMPVDLVAKHYMSLSDEETKALEAFTAKRESEEKAREERELAVAAARGGRDGAPTEKPTAEQVAQALAKLGMLAQAEAESLGLEFDLTYEDRLEQAHDALNAVAFCGNGRG